jgi:hypothetical protein
MALRTFDDWYGAPPHSGIPRSLVARTARCRRPASADSTITFDAFRSQPGTASCRARRLKATTMAGARSARDPPVSICNSRDRNFRSRRYSWLRHSIRPGSCRGYALQARLKCSRALWRSRRPPQYLCARQKNCPCSHTTASCWRRAAGLCAKFRMMPRVRSDARIWPVLLAPFFCPRPRELGPLTNAPLAWEPAHPTRATLTHVGGNERSIASRSGWNCGKKSDEGGTGKGGARLFLNEVFELLMHGAATILPPPSSLVLNRGVDAAVTARSRHRTEDHHECRPALRCYRKG